MRQARLCYCKLLSPRATNIQAILTAVLATACTVSNPAFDLDDKRNTDADPGAGVDGSLVVDASVVGVVEDAEPNMPTRDAMMAGGNFDAMTTPSTLPDCKSDPSLFLCLRFESTVVNESSSGLGVNATGVRFESGPDGLAARMDRTVDIHMPESRFFDTGETTLSIWYFLTRLPVDGERAGLFDNNNQSGFFIYPNGYIQCTEGNRMVGVGGFAEAGQWNSVSCIMNRSSLTLWHNGKWVAETSTSAPFSDTGNSGVAIGRNAPPGDHLVGLIDNARMWSRTLTPAEICANAHGCVKP
jgi:Concanavalin A-like lectin/glucanases superfamily